MQILLKPNSNEMVLIINPINQMLLIGIKPSHEQDLCWIWKIASVAPQSKVTTQSSLCLVDLFYFGSKARERMIFSFSQCNFKTYQTTMETMKSMKSVNVTIVTFHVVI